MGRHFCLGAVYLIPAFSRKREKEKNAPIGSLSHLWERVRVRDSQHGLNAISPAKSQFPSVSE